jgi:hypothetical protein
MEHVFAKPTHKVDEPGCCCRLDWRRFAVSVAVSNDCGGLVVQNDRAIAKRKPLKVRYPRTAQRKGDWCSVLVTPCETYSHSQGRRSRVRVNSSP